VSPRDERRFEPGQELEMVQWGRAGRAVDRGAWWTSTDIDGAFIIPAEHVTVLEVTRNKPPTFTGAALSRGQVIAVLGSGAEAWDGQGILVVPSVYDLEIRAGSGELLGLVERGVLRPKTIVGETVALEQAGDVIGSMDRYETLGFTVITGF